MTSIDRTNYPRFRYPPTPTELRDAFTPTQDESIWATKKTREPAACLTLLVLLKTSQRLGYLPALDTIPYLTVMHLRACL